MLKKLLLAVVALVASIGMAIAAVNINTATEQELDSLPGVGAVKAKAIVDYRKAHGNFKTIEDIKNVSGIGDKTFDGFKDQIAVSGATTVTAAPPAMAKKDAAKPKDDKAAAGAMMAPAKAGKAEAKSSAAASTAASAEKKAKDEPKADAKSSAAASSKMSKADKKAAKAAASSSAKSAK